MHILNVGSLNIDHVYRVPHFVRPGETLAATDYRVFAGGKGFNQSIALARAGVATVHAGCVGPRAEWLVERLQRERIDTTHLRVDDTPTGHAIIQVAPSGENAIVLYGGANLCVSQADIEAAVGARAPGDYLLLQNETSHVPHAIRCGRERGLKVVFNPAPMKPEVKDYPLESVDLCILNETEATELTGATDPDDARRVLRERCPDGAVVLTLGARGALYAAGNTIFRQDAQKVQAVDTTAAGDTFIGFFLAELMRSADPARALALGCRAAAICVTRPGASDSIPLHREVVPT